MKNETKLERVKKFLDENGTRYESRANGVVYNTNVGIVKRTERGWAGHFCCAFRCAFRRNTLLEYKGKRVVVSTVGRMYDNRGELDTVGHNRYYETMAFESDEEDSVYHDIDIEKQIQLDCEWQLNEFDDNKANEMHENAVKWVSEQMSKENIKIIEA